MNSLLLLAQADAENAAAGGAFLGGVLLFVVIFWAIAIAATIFWIWMMVDVLTSNMEANEKILWFLVIFFLHVIGAIIYLVVARPKRSGSLAAT
jgi:uncharacterized membrane protein